MLNSGLLGGILGAELGMLFAGLFYLFQGKIKLSKTKTVGGPRARIGSFILIVPMILIILLGLFTAPSGSSAINAIAAYMISAQGIIISVFGLIIGCILIYSAPTV